MPTIVGRDYSTVLLDRPARDDDFGIVRDACGGALRVFPGVGQAPGLPSAITGDQ
ncbi:hypothetical protein [Paraburkholderia sp. J41]|uniref:hypothetical protein n=1 Tax=Paraburkholderia sp. J41 TaxID=2805433 RepID=UPI002AC337B0|nr:hypothetical protein [Paraburkholderia sp. J41]